MYGVDAVHFAQQWVETDEYVVTPVTRIGKHTSFEFKEIDLMQYTGLSDKNGANIFEGDIVQFSEFDCNGIDTTRIGVVAWSNGSFSIWGSMDSEYFGCDGAFDLGWARAQDDEFEVIGNIYSSPELLN